jgi:predicted nucleic acid-binding protein
VTYLLDTNVLVYAIDDNEPVKRPQARALLRHLAGSGEAVLSTQTLAEFANVTLLKLDPPLPPDRVYRFVELHEQAFRPLPLTPTIVLEAVRGVRDHKFGYYDAQIWAAARLNQVPYVLSEVFNEGSTIEGVTFLNPFAPDFEIDRL